jgi:diguanylate cyclase (GGDEF)-like protein
MNRAGLDEVLRRPFVLSHMQRGHLAILYIDLNDFKKLNDVHGHKVGDCALEVLARRLKNSARAQDYVVRLGGDEFICIIADSDPEQAANSVSDRLMLICQTPITVSENEIILSPSIGIAVARPGMSWDTLLDRADAAMFQAKRNKGRFAVMLRGADDQIAKAV